MTCSCLLVRKMNNYGTKQTRHLFWVEKVDELLVVLEKAVIRIKQHKTQVVLNVKFGMDDGEK